MSFPSEDHPDGASGTGPADVQQAELEAERCLDRFGPTAPETLAARYYLARIYQHLGRSSTAAPLIEDVAMRCTQVLGDTNPVTLMASALRAKILSDIGELDRSRKIADSLRQKLLRLGDQDEPLAIETAIADLALTYADLGGFEEAVQLESNVLKALRLRVGPDADATVNSMYRLARFSEEVGDFARAASIERELLSLQLQLLGPMANETLALQEKVATHLALWPGASKRDRKEAIRLSSDALQVFTKLRGSTSKEALDAERTHLRVISRVGVLDGRIAKRAAHVVSVNVQIFGDLSPEATDAREVYLSILAATNLSDPHIREMADKVIEARRNLYGPNDHGLIVIAMLRISAYLELGLYREALQSSEEWSARTSTERGDSDPLSIQALVLRGQAAHRLGDPIADDIADEVAGLLRRVTRTSADEDAIKANLDYVSLLISLGQRARGLEALESLKYSLLADHDPEDKWIQLAQSLSVELTR